MLLLLVQAKTRNREQTLQTTSIIKIVIAFTVADPLHYLAFLAKKQGKKTVTHHISAFSGPSSTWKDDFGVKKGKIYWIESKKSKRVTMMGFMFYFYWLN